MHEVKSASVFCLEPAGDTPFRRSIADSIALGCIPVLFNNVSDLTAGLIWDDWRGKSRVLLPREDFITGQLSLYKTLKSLPDDVVASMQTQLRVHGQKFQISMHDDPNDSISVMLQQILSARGLSRIRDAQSTGH